MNTYIALGLEELVVAFRVFGKNEEAQGLLLSSLGEISQQEERGRLLAAHHSLLARDLLIIKNDKAEIAPALEKIMTSFFSTQKIIRSGKTGIFGEDVISFYLSGTGWLEHSITDSVIHRFMFIDDTRRDLLAKKIFSFFSPNCDDYREIPTVNIPDAVLVDTDQEERRSFDKILSFFDNSPPHQLSNELFAGDITNAVWRGSIMWIINKDPENIFSQGILLVQGLNRLWAINSSVINEEPQFIAELVQVYQFKDYIEELINLEPVI